MYRDSQHERFVSSRMTRARFILAKRRANEAAAFQTREQVLDAAFTSLQTLPPGQEHFDRFLSITTRRLNLVERNHR
jgi:hypothetical protein